MERPDAEAASQQLEREGATMRLVSCDGMLGMRRMSTQNAPLDPERRIDILADVMVCENHLVRWLGEQKEKLQKCAPVDELDQLGLGPVAPEPRSLTLRLMQSSFRAGEA